MNDDIVDRNKRLRFTRDELHVLIMILEGHLETEDDDAVFRAGQSAATKMRSALRWPIAKEAQNE